MKKLLALISLSILLLTGCESDDDNNTPSIPDSYNFENVDYSGQTDRLNQLAALTFYAKSVVGGERISAQAMKDMFTNEGGNGGGYFSFTSTKQLADKCAPGYADMMNSLFDNFEEDASTLVAGSDGVAGTIETNTGTTYFFDENGYEYAQLIDKGIMGGCFMHQIQNVYLGVDKMTANNESNTEGKNYTDMEHHWDEAFGYFGAGTNWPTDTEGERFWAKYAWKMSSEITGGAYDCPNTIMDAFIAGRFAITQKDYEERDAQIAIIREQLEYISAGTAIHYLNSAISGYTDTSARLHYLSEALEFINALKYVYPTTRIITNDQINETLNSLQQENFYNLSLQQIQTTKNILSNVYGFQNFADQL